MKIKLDMDVKRFLFILGFFLLPLPLGPEASADISAISSSATISMDLQNANLKDILKVFSIQSGLNFIASEAIQDRTVTLYLERVPIQEAMDKLFKANNLSYEVDPDSNIIMIKDWGKAEIETITKVFPLKYQSVPGAQILSESKIKLGATTTNDISTTIRGVLSKYGKVEQDPRTNSLIITDLPSRFPILEQVLAKLDVPVPAVLIEVEMLDVSRNLVDKMGFKFGQSPMTLTLKGAVKQTVFPFGPWTSSDSRPAKTNKGGLSSLGSVALNSTDATAYSVILDFLKSQADARYLARPRILTLNNETAEIKITSSEAVGVKTTTQGTTTTEAEPERVQTGVSLRVTPQVNIETGEITMFINPEVSEAGSGNNIITPSGTYTYRDPETRSTKTTVRINDGETIIVGGLIRNERTETVTKLPIFGDLPLVGALFRHKDKSKDRERELLIFITPRILREPNAASYAQLKKNSVPEREQGENSVGERIAIIDANLNKYERKK